MNQLSRGLRPILATAAAVAFVITGLFLAANRPGVTPLERVASADATAFPATQIKTVFIILMENTSWSDIHGNTVSAPFINELLKTSSYAQQYFNYPNAPGATPYRPSETNYVWLEGGSKVYTDHTFTNNDPPSAANSTGETDHLVTRLNNAGISWKSYQEDITGTDCPLLPVAGYQPKHNPMIFFRDVTDNNSPTSPYCIAHIRPLTELSTDLISNTVARYNFITPNQCNAMHDTCSADRIKQGDTYLAGAVNMITRSTAFQDNGVLFITWDENTAPRVDSIGMIVHSKLGRGGGYSNTIRYDHSSTVRTMQEIFGVLPPMRMAVTATDLSDLFLPGTFVLPMSSLVLTGPTRGAVGQSLIYSSTVLPPTATLPITFRWEATGISPTTRLVSTVTDWISLTWQLAGQKTVTVTANNGGSSLTATRIVTILRQLFLPDAPDDRP